eukprot:gb/GEZN01006548.1/.p1 GENE.gb/GEZN01006548.1/~~gb/GEZN01006548.1/.p1  ORF type:complete len:493 (-),score=62.41 gb/GEZN01006548.1/:39-1517(-)
MLGSLSFFVMLLLLSPLQEVLAMKWNTRDGRPTKIVGHRGDPYYAPEHSLASYIIALQMGADQVEPDLVLSRDGVAFCSHDLHLSQTTDVSTKANFANRKRIQNGLEDWWYVDFTSQELKTLRLKQTQAALRNSASDGLFAPQTFREYLSLMQQSSLKFREKAFSPLLIPEIKAGKYHASWNTARNLSETYFEDLVLTALQDFDAISCDQHLNNNLTLSAGPVIQSFEEQSLRYIQSACPSLARLRLLEGYLTITPALLSSVAEYATGVGFHRSNLLPDKPNHQTLVSLIHSHNLDAYVYVLQNAREDSNIDRLFGGDVQDYFLFLFRLGVDAIFTEKLDEGLAARKRYEDLMVATATHQTAAENCIALLTSYRISSVSLFALAVFFAILACYHYRNVVHIKLLKSGEEEYVPFGLAWRASSGPKLWRAHSPTSWPPLSPSISRLVLAANPTTPRDDTHTGGEYLAAAATEKAPRGGSPQNLDSPTTSDEFR